MKRLSSPHNPKFPNQFKINCDLALMRYIFPQNLFDEFTFKLISATSISKAIIGVLSGLNTNQWLLLIKKHIETNYSNNF